MPTITIKNIPEKIHQKLKQNASQNHRSLNNEIIACLESSVSTTAINSELLL
ncbi:Arc family DNA-binding protein [Deltaproteobacteria bacterium TL4]